MIKNFWDLREFAFLWLTQNEVVNIAVKNLKVGTHSGHKVYA